MSFYLNIPFLGNDYVDVDVEYDIIEGDESVGLAEDYEFTATCMDEQGKIIDISDDLSSAEIWEVVQAIKKDMRDMQNDI